MNGSQNMHWLFLTLMKLMVTTLILVSVCEDNPLWRDGKGARKKKETLVKNARTMQKNKSTRAHATHKKKKSLVFLVSA